MKIITEKHLLQFQNYLMEEEKSAATVQKYVRDVERFAEWCSGRELTKALVLQYKAFLNVRHKPTAVNAALSSLNSFFHYYERYDLRMKKLKVQRCIFASSERELSKAEYERLVRAARERGNERLCLLMQTVCATGIRVSELKFITVEALSRGRTDIFCKGKTRCVFLPLQLCKMLKDYVRRKQLKSGAVFVTKSGKPLDRSNIWSDMKKLCRVAGVSEQKVFPHNLRHLFARTYYSIQKDIVRLADILGHSSINTTRIYTTESGDVHRRQLQRLGLLRC